MKPAWTNRDLSWLDFNARVLEGAYEPTNSILQRLRFLAIAYSNLEEFFMIRFPAMRREAESSEVASALRKTDFLMADAQIAYDALTPALRGEEHFVHADVTAPFSAIAEDLARAAFDKTIVALPHEIGDFKIYDMSLLKNGDSIAVFPQSGVAVRLSRRVPMVQKMSHSSGTHYFFLDQLVVRFLGEMHGLSEQPIVMRLVRDADLALDLEAEEAAEFVASRLRDRDSGTPVALQVTGCNEHDETALSLVSGAQLALRLDPRQVLFSRLSVYFGQIRRCLPRTHSVSRPYIVQGSMFDRIDRGDLITHYPYDSFDNYVNFLTEASRDPQVTKIWQTIYRLDELSPIVPALLEASRTKEVGVIIELRARFDEKNNLGWAEKFQKAGVKTCFGFDDLKMHAKLSQVTRGLQKYTHLSTGNFNAGTAQLYTDLSLYTTDPLIGQDVATFFEHASRERVPPSPSKIIYSPTALAPRLLELIEGEIRAAREGQSAYIFIKVNALVDPTVIGKLYEASRHGVHIDLMVRGACSLVPGVPGVSDTIQVVSLIDDFLEHSRVYYFGSQEGLFLSSADWMPRNFFARLEVAFPVEDRACRAYLLRIIHTYLRDDVRLWEQDCFARWSRVRSRTGFRAQAEFERLAALGYRSDTSPTQV